MPRRMAFLIAFKFVTAKRISVSFILRRSSLAPTSTRCVPGGIIILYETCPTLSVILAADSRTRNSSTVISLSIISQSNCSVTTPLCITNHGLSAVCCAASIARTISAYLPSTNELVVITRPVRLSVNELYPVKENILTGGTCPCASGIPTATNNNTKTTAIFRRIHNLLTL